MPGEKFMRLCEPCMVPPPDGKQIAVLLRENYRRSQSMFSTTDDKGKNWKPVQELNGVLTGDRHCAKYLKDGRLFISFRDMNRRSPYYGSWVAWIGIKWVKCYHKEIHVSWDESRITVTVPREATLILDEKEIRLKPGTTVTER